MDEQSDLEYLTLVDARRQTNILPIYRCYTLHCISIHSQNMKKIGCGESMNCCDLFVRFFFFIWPAAMDCFVWAFGVWVPFWLRLSDTPWWLQTFHSCNRIVSKREFTFAFIIFTFVFFFFHFAAMKWCAISGDYYYYNCCCCVRNGIANDASGLARGAGD